MLMQKDAKKAAMQCGNLQLNQTRTKGAAADKTNGLDVRAVGAASPKRGKRVGRSRTEGHPPETRARGGASPPAEPESKQKQGENKSKADPRARNHK